MEKNNSQSKKALTSAKRILAILFGFGSILGFLLTPLGIETRMLNYGPWCSQGSS